VCCESTRHLLTAHDAINDSGACRLPVVRSVRSTGHEPVRAAPRFALITPHYPAAEHPRVGGLGSYAKIAAEALRDRGWVVDVFCLDAAPADREVEPGIRIIGVELPEVHWRIGALDPFVRSLALLRAVRRRDRQARYDAIESPNQEGLAWAPALSLGRRFFLHLYTSDRQHAGYGTERLSAGERAGLAWNRIAVLCARNLLTHSVVHAAAMAAENNVAIARIAIVPLATASPPATAPAATRDRVLFIGALERRKGADVFAQASVIAAATRPALRWTMVGYHPRSALQLTPEQGAAVELVGQVEQEQLERYWAEALCVVVPSRYESFGLVVIEAMARGVPVIAARAGALPEVVGDAGILVDGERPEQIAAEVQRLVSDPARYSMLAAAGQQRFRDRYRVDVFGEQLERLFLGAERPTPP
jgi:glycosyltransferase involved in cell wall biosynthesis